MLSTTGQGVLVPALPGLLLAMAGGRIHLTRAPARRHTDGAPTARGLTLSRRWPTALTAPTEFWRAWGAVPSVSATPGREARSPRR